MSLQAIDGYDEYGVVADIVTYGPWTAQSATALSTNTHQGSGQSLQLSGASSLIRLSVGENTNYSRMVGFYIYIIAYPSADATLVYLNAPLSSQDIHLKLRSNGTLTHSYVGAGSKILALNTWYYIEYQAQPRSSNNSVFGVKIDGVYDINSTTYDSQTGATTTDYIEISSKNASMDILIDDTYVDNNSVTFLGESVVGVFPVTGDDSVVMSNQAGSGANYLHLDDPSVASDGDATYVYTNTVGEKDSYTIEDMPAASAVHAVSLVTHAKKTDAGVTAMNHGVKTGADEQQALIAMGTSYDRTETIFPTYDGVNAWTEAKVNALTPTIELMS